MSDQPVILVVDDDISSLTITEQELRKRYGRDYRVLARQSAAAALDELRRLKETGQPVALILADQNMPEMAGTDFLGEARAIDPVAKRVMLVSWGDRSSPQAILTGCAVGQIEFFITKPWHTAPDERFHREVAGFLYEWSRLQRPVYEAVRLVGERWAPRSHELRDLLGRNGVAYGFYDSEGDEGREILRDAGLDESPRLPVAVVFGGRILEDPSNREVAEALGVRSRPSADECDLLIVGAGPAGLAAAVYGSSEGLSTVVLEREALGGQAGQSTMIHNYVGFPAGISGDELTFRAYEQAWQFGAEFLFSNEAVSLRERRRSVRRGARRRRVAPGSRRDPRHGRQLSTAGDAAAGLVPRLRRVLRLGVRPRRGRSWTWRSSSSEAATPPGRRRSTSPSTRATSRWSLAATGCPDRCRATSSPSSRTRTGSPCVRGPWWSTATATRACGS